jgi:hypothetical protein
MFKLTAEQKKDQALNARKRLVEQQRQELQAKKQAEWERRKAVKTQGK